MDHESWDFFYSFEQYFIEHGNGIPRYLIFYIVFGAWNMFSFSMCAGLGYLFLAAFHVLAKRTVHKIDLYSNLETVDVTFFSPFWKPRTINFHIS